MAQTVTNVSYSKPAVNGAIYVGALNATLPTSATTTVSSIDFKALGYVSTDGLTNSNSPESDSILAWGGDTVLNVQTAKPDTFQFTLLEVLNVEVLKTVYGEDNVTGTLATGIKISANATPAEPCTLVIDTVMQGALKRITVPNAVLTTVDDITYTDSDAVGYGLTFSARPDEEGNTHYEYIQTETVGE